MPTRDITAIKRPRLVMRSGAVYFPSEIYPALGITPFATAPRVTAAATAAPAGTAVRGSGAQFGWPVAADDGD